VKRPKRLTIEPFVYTVEARPEWSAATGNMGNCITDAQQIIIDAGLTDQSERDTVLHEALHAAWGQTPLKKKYEEDAEEEIIWTLTPRLLSLIQDNPELIQWLSGR
jgi:hypothetical protein